MVQNPEEIAKKKMVRQLQSTGNKHGAKKQCERQVCATVSSGVFRHHSESRCMACLEVSCQESRKERKRRKEGMEQNGSKQRLRCHGTRIREARCVTWDAQGVKGLATEFEATPE